MNREDVRPKPVHLREEERDFNSGCFGAVGTVNGVGVDGLSEVSADCALSSLLRIGCAHQFAVFHNGVFAFKNLNLDRTGNHEVNEVFEEGAFAVNSVESFGFLTGEPFHLGSNDLQIVGFKAAVNLSDYIFRNCVGFDNRKCAFNCHFNLLKSYKKIKQGKADQVSVFSDDPVQMAKHWQSLGAEYLHLIDLDGAFEGKSVNAEIVKEICQKLDIPVQLGGGIRSEEIADFWLNLGVTRIIIGTMALENFALFEKICKKYPGRVGVSLDVQGKKLKTRGWVEDSGKEIDEILPKLQNAGCAFIIYTDIERDGMHSELNFAEIERLAKLCPLPLIAAGGVSTMESVKKLLPLAKNSSLQGIVSGRAIYEGTLDFNEAINFIKKN